MVRRVTWLFLLLLLSGCLANPAPPHAHPRSTDFRIAFLACIDQRSPQPLWESVEKHEPDLIVFLGDNVYADTTREEEFDAAYEALASQPVFSKLRREVPIIGTWDDHDFGENDGGADFVGKAAAKAAFLRFFKIEDDRRPAVDDGIYDAWRFSTPAGTLQVILLDTRTFRTPLKRATSRRPQLGPYTPNRDQAATILGPAQWGWLEEELRQPADIRILVSSIQVLPNTQGFEGWRLFPNELEKLLTLLRHRNGGALLIASGDKHMSELSRLSLPNSREVLTEFTTGSLNRPRREVVPRNRYRAGSIVIDSTFSLMTISAHHQRPIFRIDAVTPERTERLYPLAVPDTLPRSSKR